MKKYLLLTALILGFGFSTTAQIKRIPLKTSFNKTEDTQKLFVKIEGIDGSSTIVNTSNGLKYNLFILTTNYSHREIIKNFCKFLLLNLQMNQVLA